MNKHEISWLAGLATGAGFTLSVVSLSLSAGLFNAEDDKLHGGSRELCPEYNAAAMAHQKSLVYDRDQGEIIFGPEGDEMARIKDGIAVLDLKAPAPGTPVHP